MGRMEQVKRAISKSELSAKDIRIKILKDQLLELLFQRDKLGHYFLQPKIDIVEQALIEEMKL